MSERNLPAIKPQLTPEIWHMIESVAPAMHQARLFGVTSQQQAAAIMLKGYELGLSLTSSFEFIQVVEGKPTLSPRGALALIMQHPECAGVAIEDIKDAKGLPQSCRVTMKRRNGFEYTTEFSMEDAARAGLVKDRGAWTMYPANMLRWRAVGFCADVVLPDVIGGMKRADELGATITPEGDVVEGSWREVAQAPKVTPKAEPPAVDPLQQLIADFGAEAVLAANGGQIPTAEQVEAVRAKLLAERDIEV